MKKVALFTVLAFSSILLLAGSAFALEQTQPGEDNFQYAQSISTQDVASTGMISGAKKNLSVDNGQISPNLYEHYGLAPAWGSETNSNAVSPDRLNFGLENVQ